MIEHINESNVISAEELQDFVNRALAQVDWAGKRILFIIPDSTRSMPMPAMFRALHTALSGKVAKMDILIALGTHPPMPDDAINRLLGISSEERAGIFRDVNIYNHAWDNPEALTYIGTITDDEIAEISTGLMRQSVDVTINKRVLDYDVLCVVGPVFPHEVVGFSGGNKYFFPGISGAEILNLFHWLGALISNPVINGAKHTPVRQVVNRAANFIRREKYCFALNVSGKSCHGIFFGSPEDAWNRAADMAAKTHIVYKEHPYKSVLAMAPLMYDDIWVAGKCMYKLEPVVADGGELIIYAPHVKDVSFTHGELIKRIGYHTRD
ncbi:MAG: DUF2088 domain-containing protein, partial [Candidatus Hydrogenedentes bacterium]|nr:DUF2088 domain-containing protein [Candidatus Hydrogenedentota bacterium]